MHSLLVSYRNDGEAPESKDGRYGLGDTEWQDVAAAMRFAREHGATEIVLMGWSMGGAIAMQAALRAEDRGLLSGIVLESPAVDWSDILHFQGTGYGLPAVVDLDVDIRSGRPEPVPQLAELRGADAFAVDDGDQLAVGGDEAVECGDGGGHRR